MIARAFAEIFSSLIVVFERVAGSFGEILRINLEGLL